MDNLVKFLINPMVPAILYIVWRFIKGGMKRKHLVLLFFYLYLIAIPLTPKLISMLWKVEDTVLTNHTYDAVVVLAGIVPEKCYLSHGSQYEKGMFRCSNDFQRAYGGLSLVQSGHAKRFIIAEDQSSRVDEAGVVTQFLLANHLTAEQIWVAGKVKSTYDEAVEIQKLVASGEIKDFILVTSERHMRRAAATFERIGLSPAYFSVDKRPELEVVLADFKPRNTVSTQKMIYEVVGFIGYWVVGR